MSKLRITSLPVFLVWGIAAVACGGASAFAVDHIVTAKATITDFMRTSPGRTCI